MNNPSSPLVLITGASRGLGRQLARSCSAHSYRLALVARDQQALEALAIELRDSRGTEVGVFVADLAQPGAAHSVASAVAEKMGPVEILVNNAGIGWWRPFLEHSAEDHDRIIDLNFRAVVHLTHAVLPAMLEQGRGLIINIGSDLVARPLGNMAVYTASKQAMRGFSRSLGQEVRPLGIKVSQVDPGIIDSSFGGAAEGSQDEAYALQLEPLAEVILQVMQQPALQVIDELELHPMGQEY